MILYNEIRLGNWISVNNKPVEVSYINKSGCGTTDEVFALFEQVEQLPVTDKLLTQSGFVRDLYGYKSRLLAINQYDDVYYLRIPQGTGFGGGIKYVHQLQNLYYDISGQELNLTKTYFAKQASVAG